MTATASDPLDPLARGLCGRTRCGGMNDFIDVQIDKWGRAWAAFVDVCTQACVTDPAIKKDEPMGFAGTLVTGPALRGDSAALISLPELRAEMDEGHSHDDCDAWCLAMDGRRPWSGCPRVHATRPTPMRLPCPTLGKSLSTEDSTIDDTMVWAWLVGFSGRTRELMAFAAALVTVASYLATTPSAWLTQAPWGIAIAAGLLLAAAPSFVVDLRANGDRAAHLHLAKAYDMALDASRRGISSEKRVSATIRGICIELQRAFEIRNGRGIGVCVKRLVSFTPADRREPTLAAETLCRDTFNDSRRPWHHQEMPHELELNTDFKGVFDDMDSGRQVRTFRSNALPFMGSYENTSFRRHPNRPWLRGRGLLSGPVRYATWPLRYKSAIVAPIVASALAEKRDQTLVGFLCLDSARMFAFSPSDEVILEGIAIAMHPLLKKVVGDTNAVARPTGGNENDVEPETPL